MTDHELYLASEQAIADARDWLANLDDDAAVDLFAGTADCSVASDRWAHSEMADHQLAEAGL